MLIKIVRGAIVFLIGGVILAVVGRTDVELPQKIEIGVIKKEQPIVIFNHKKHHAEEELGIKCIFCHHMTKEDEAPNRCSACHLKEKRTEGGKEIIGAQDAFHKKCKGCHERIREVNPKSKAPTTDCKVCHSKKK